MALMPIDLNRTYPEGTDNPKPYSTILPWANAKGGLVSRKLYTTLRVHLPTGEGYRDGDVFAAPYVFADSGLRSTKNGTFDGSMACVVGDSASSLYGRFNGVGEPVQGTPAF